MHGRRVAGWQVSCAVAWRIEKGKGNLNNRLGLWKQQQASLALAACSHLVVFCRRHSCAGIAAVLHSRGKVGEGKPKLSH